MQNLFFRQRIAYFLSILVFLGFYIVCSTALAATNEKAISSNSEDGRELESSYNAAITQAYQELSGNAAFSIESRQFNVLLDKVTAAHKNKNPEQVLGLILNNMSIIKGSYTNKQIPDLVNIALQNHSLSVARNVRMAIEAQAPRAIVATCDYEIANYLSQQNSWDEALAIIKTLDLSNDLSSINADKAFIIWGAALQHTKKHRQAIEYYQRIKTDSPLYPLAQLDTALVYIRQDWWTDAQIAMQNAVKANGESFNEFTNRIYTTLGFSQLQQGFYRNARDSFRKVKIKSEYADQALLGLGMAALNQEDFVGAFNAFDQLKKRQQPTTPVEQSYLMAAFTLTKLKQNKSAAAAYTEAQIYYENKVNLFSNAANQLVSPANNDVQLQISNLTNEGFKESPAGSAYAWQLKTLARLLAYPISENTKANIANSYSKIANAYQTDTKSNLDAKISVLNSYLNQSRFGLTKLYDTP
ncbi:MAG: hypothetical protein EOO52_06235 [Gammaproteobacteria bacterium]|nr:MAG: hypothetical protein EOO52_06235 [Gammaproteobacteria bacterium]